MKLINKIIIKYINKMNKRVFGTKLSSILNLQNQQMVLEKRKRKEKKVHTK
jgi:hypothetical protein